ncbi:sperm-egg fusion protein TMEM95 isoform X3 [Paroedura picta]|uniref:sperm-egg fusion protein TMEM95 isoform X3 n=1 Tax=Paroedura picta TaxID=143630 RepID=UPI004057A4FB
MASAAFAPRGAPPAPTAATLLLLLLLLAGGGLEAEGCLPCRLHFKNLKGRFARLCAQYRERFGRQNCTSYPWGRGSFQGFALDELSLDLILEKTHRVFRVIALCPPACHVSAPVVNCSSCRTEDTPCWEMKTCYPERLDLPKAIMLLSTIACSCFFLGMVTCALEFRFHPGVAME